MSLSTYAGLQAEAASWLRRADLTAEIPTFIAMAEAQMNRRLRVRPMLARICETWANEYVALPPDFLSEREVRLSGPPVTVLHYLTPQIIDERARTPTTGRPRYYAISGGQLRLHPAPNQAYSAELSYLQTLPALSEANPSNWLLASHPDAYLYGTLLQSAPYLRADERLSTWSSLFTAVLADIEAADRTGWAARLLTDAPVGASPFNIISGR